MAGYDAFLLLSFGGPEGPEDVLPFLRNVAAGRDIPQARLAEVAEHYYRYGGVSPINGQCRELIAAIEPALPGLPVYWGNRNWHPYLADTLRQMAADGVRRAVALATSGYSSHSGCRQYLDDIERARAKAGPGAPQIDKIPPFSDHPAFADCFARSAALAIGSLPAGLRDGAELIFVAHSVPSAMAAASGPPGPGGAYVAQLSRVAERVAASLGRRSWRLAYCSRSGPPAMPWLEPDIGDTLADLAGAGARAAVVVPIGFVSDHMEVRHDLDVEAAGVARELGLEFARAATPGTDPAFVAMITELVRDYSDGGPAAGRRSLGPEAAALCGPGCCGAGRPAGRPGQR